MSGASFSESDLQPEAPAGHVVVGSLAPDLALPSQTGKVVRLSDFRSKRVVVLYFYPKDNTSGCTAEACGFRDRYEVFQEAGAEVIGVSADSVASHARFAERNRLPFLLLSDEGGRVRKRYGARLGPIPSRVTYVIDQEGVVRYVFSSLFGATRHVDEALRIVREIAAAHSA